MANPIFSLKHQYRRFRQMTIRKPRLASMFDTVEPSSVPDHDKPAPSYPATNIFGIQFEAARLVRKNPLH